MKALKSFATNCGPLSEMMRGLASGKASSARCTIISTSCSVTCLQQAGLLADFVMYDGATVAIKNTAQIIEGAGKVQIGHVDVPMRVG